MTQMVRAVQVILWPTAVHRAVCFALRVMPRSPIVTYVKAP